MIKLDDSFLFVAWWFMFGTDQSLFKSTTTPIIAILKYSTCCDPRFGKSYISSCSKIVWGKQSWRTRFSAINLTLLSSNRSEGWPLLVHTMLDSAFMRFAVFEGLHIQCFPGVLRIKLVLSALQSRTTLSSHGSPQWAFLFLLLPFSHRKGWLYL